MSTQDHELILIVDDEPGNLQLLGSFLKKNEYSVGVAQNGQQALDFVGKKVPDMILLDVMMPNMDGFEVCRRLKVIDCMKEVPILFITALSDTESILKGFQAGGVDYINKPIVQEEVLARIGVQLSNKKLIRELSEANSDLQQLNQVKNRFLGMAAHDLRNPLGAIIGFSEFILEEEYGPVQEEQYPILKRINSASQQMLNLVNDLLDVSVIESGNLQLQISKGSLKLLIEERVMLLEITAAKKEISLTVSSQTDENSEFDPERMAQVVDNLIGNAIKFSPKHSEIKVSLSEKSDQMAIEVRDSGPGISEEDQQKLFSNFQQLSAKATAGEKGTGLGLAICQKIVDVHQGEIIVDSQMGKGTAFIVMIPMLATQAEGRSVGNQLKTNR